MNIFSELTTRSRRGRGPRSAGRCSPALKGSLLLRHERAHGLTYDRAYAAFVKGRLQSLKTGRPPGAPSADDDDDADHTVSAAVVSDAPVVAERRDQRKRAAEAVAPGAGNGIGAPEGQADGWMDEVMAARPTPYLG